MKRASLFDMMKIALASLLTVACLSPAFCESPEPLVTLELDGESKWVMDDHTRDAAKALNEALGPLEERPQTVEAFHGEGVALRDQLRALVGGCEMEGPGHDQLHVFLGAIWPRIATLQESEELDELGKADDEVRELMAEYARHFE